MKSFSSFPYSITKRVDFTKVLPPETIAAIINYVDVVDCMSLQLTCRAMAAHMPSKVHALLEERGQFGDINSMHIPSNSKMDARRRQQIRILRELEARIRSDRRPGAIDILLCTTCGKIRPRMKFTDSQRIAVRCDEHKPAARWESKTLPGRDCIDCQILRGKWTTGIVAHVVGGDKAFACLSWRNFVPVEQRRTGRVQRCHFDIVLKDSFGKLPSLKERGHSRYIQTWELCKRCARVIKNGSFSEQVLKGLRGE